jgi:hypothetical protein
MLSSSAEREIKKLKHVIKTGMDDSEELREELRTKLDDFKILLRREFKAELHAAQRRLTSEADSREKEYIEVIAHLRNLN